MYFDIKVLSSTNDDYKYYFVRKFVSFLKRNTAVALHPCEVRSPLEIVYTCLNMNACYPWLSDCPLHEKFLKICIWLGVSCVTLIFLN